MLCASTHLSSLCLHRSFPQWLLFSIWLGILTVSPACSWKTPGSTMDVSLRPTVDYLARSKNTFTLSLENTDPSRSILVTPGSLRVADNTGATYAIALEVMTVGDQLDKLILPREKMQIRYVLDRSIPDSVTSLSFTLEELEAQEGTGPGRFALPSLQWMIVLADPEQAVAAVDSRPGFPSPTLEEDPESLLVLRMDNLRRRGFRFDLVIENKAKDRSFTVGILDEELKNVIISDDLGNPYQIDQFNLPDPILDLVTYTQRTIAPQTFIRVPIVLTHRIDEKAQEVNFYFTNISARLDSGKTQSLRPRQWAEPLRDATPSEIAEEQKDPTRLEAKLEETKKRIKKQEELQAEIAKVRRFNEEVEKQMKEAEKKHKEMKKAFDEKKKRLKRRFEEQSQVFDERVRQRHGEARKEMRVEEIPNAARR